MRSEGKTVVIGTTSSGNLSLKTINPPLENIGLGEVRIRGIYSSLTYKDFLVKTGLKSLGTEKTRGVGTDYIGEVQESRSRNFKTGDLVWVVGTSLGSGWTGGMCELLVVNESQLMPLPSGWSPLQAAVGGTPLLTASLAWMKILRSLGSIPNSIAISGAGGSVGGFALEIALRNSTDQIWAISGKPASTFELQSGSKVELLSPADLARGSRFSLLPERWECGIDVLGGTTLDGMLKASKRSGIVIALGMVLGESATINLAPLFLRSVSLCGLNLEAEIATEYTELCAIADPVIRAFEIPHEPYTPTTIAIESALTSRGAGKGDQRPIFDLTALGR